MKKQQLAALACIFFLTTSASHAAMMETEDTSVVRILNELNAYPKNTEERADKLLEAHGELLKHNISLAQKCAEEALIISEKIDYKFGMACSYNSLAIVAKKEGNYALAIKNYIRAIDYLDYGDPETNQTGRGILYRNIALAYKEMNDYDRAEKYLDKALTISKQQKDTFNIIQCYDTRGSVHLRKGDTLRGREAYAAGIELAQQFDEPGLMAVVLLNSTHLYNPLTDRSKVENMLYEAQRFFASIDDLLGTAETHLSLGELFNHNKQSAAALTELLKGLALSKQIGSKELSSKFYNELQQTYSQLNRYEEAYRYLLLSKQLKEEMLHEKNVRTIAEMETRFELKEQQQELQATQRELKLKKADARLKEQLLYIVIATAVLLILLIVAWVLRYRERKKRLQVETDLKISTYELELETLRNVVYSNLDHQEVAPSKPELSVDLRRINNSLSNPLTERELEILEQLSAGFTNKQIAENLYISVNTVKTHLMNVYVKLDVSNRTQATQKVLNWQE